MQQMFIFGGWGLGAQAHLFYDTKNLDFGMVKIGLDAMPLSQLFYYI